MTLRDDALKLHEDNKGKIAVVSKVPVRNGEDLSLAYSPGVAEPCREIAQDPSLVNRYTNRQNLIAVVSTGSAVLGLGNIGARAAMPVMEGKGILFKTFGAVDAFPICVDTQDSDKVVELVKLLEPTFGGINLEDIKAPECFYIEEQLKKIYDGPVFHDDQHGTAVITMAGLINALKVVNKELSEVKIVVNGAGAAGMAIVKILMSAGLQNVIMCDTKGTIYEGRTEGMNTYKEEIAKSTNRELLKGTLADALKGADIFVGVSVAGAVTPEMVQSMAKDPIVFAQANPVPEISPDEAKAAGAVVVGTGRSDYPNQVNNVLAFPGIFRGAIDSGAKAITEEMKVAAAYAIANIVTSEELNPEYVLPKAFDLRVGPAVAAAVAQAAMDSGVATQTVDPQEVAENLRKYYQLNQ
ncbi:NAD(P)-dependent malic enzyme [Desulfitobacterium metallireducens]|uniref:NAD-dependent malic enzyme 4 n=1 Tax=Desulfitobacterium metallireducens DSM 15288 TaxID=871968 RepID=W0E5Q7_9FIRM|nr:NAD-dependent malic enzyme 4 [Desulfitobacterium metallireducens DSM 15288]